MPPPKEKRTAPPAAHVYRAVVERWPQKSQWDDLATITDPDDLEYWRLIVKAWDGHGWNKTNVADMFRFYQEHRLDRTLPKVSGKGNGQLEVMAHNKKVFAAVRARIEQEESQTIEGECRVK